MQVITVKSALRDYRVHFTDSPDFLGDLKQLKDKIFVVDSTVWSLYREKLFHDFDEDRVIVLPINEDRKTLSTVMEAYDELMARSVKRNTTMISVGGGILQDITGFVASTLYRGINWVFVPTTLLAQADSCIGSKTSLNYKHYKNLIGTFFPPNAIYLYPAFLQTLQDGDFFSGVGEVIKLHLIGGENKTKSLLESMDRIRSRQPAAMLEAIMGSLEVKLGYLDDEFDTGKRNMLNFGHCFGHALESTSDFLIPHGQAVLTGIVFANIVAKNRGLMSRRVFDHLCEEALVPNIMSPPTKAHLDTDRIYSAMKMDKKRVGDGLVLIMQADDYKMIKAVDLDYGELKHSMNELSDVIGVK